MYYIYLLIDSSTSLPFYVGKGKGDRAYSHLLETRQDTINIRKYNKIKSIERRGDSVLIEYVFTNIADESFAYKLETDLIDKFGRKGIDEDGILTNICRLARPPGSTNFVDNNPSTHNKGKSYEEIYGNEKAAELRNSRKYTSAKREVTAETRTKMSKSAKACIASGARTMPSNKGKKMSQETKTKMSLAHKGVKKGPMSKETKAKISASKTGVKKGPMSKENKSAIRAGQLNSEKFKNRKGYLKNRKKIIFNGDVFDSVGALIEYLNISKATFYRHVKEGKVVYEVAQ